MKILELTLTNFARVYSGMGKTKITLDFRNTKEKINLFAGANGSGKTSTMRCLQPFAYNSAMGDNTSNSNLIIKGKDGEKTITILADNGKVYYIRHIYTRKKDDTISVKSFIKEDNEELNDSGTVSTFKTILLDKLGIDETYLTLLSMSNTIKGFVEYTASERKSYASKLFTELELYNKKYKDLSVLDRNMKTLLSNVTSKLSRYQNISKEDLRHTLSEMDKNLNILNSKKTNNTQSIGSIRTQLDTYSDTIKSYDECEVRMRDILFRIESEKSKLTINVSLDELLLVINSIDNQISDVNSQEIEMKNIIIGKMDLLDAKRTNLTNVNNSLEKFDDNSNVKELQDYINQLQSDIDIIKSEYDVDFKYDMSKDDLIRGSIYLDELKSICDNFIYDVIVQDNIVPIFEEYKKDKSIKEKIIIKYDKLQDELKQYSAITARPVLPKIPEIRMKDECKKSCPYKDFYDRYHSIINSSDDEISRRMSELQHEVTRYLDYLHIIEIIERAYNHIELYGKYISKDVFDVENFINLYMDKKVVYDKDKSTLLIDTLENTERYNTLMNNLSDARKKLDFYLSNQELFNSLSKEKDELIKEISSRENEIYSLKSIHNGIVEKLSKLRQTNDENKSNKIILEKLEKINSEKIEISNKIKDMNSAMTKINELRNKLSEYVNTDKELSDEIFRISKEKESIIIALSNIETLEREELEIREKYDKISNVRYAMSPTTGLPVEFIEYYMKEVMADKINVLLDSVYHGRLRIKKDEIVVNDKEFTIPYVKNGTKINDISEASDGEKAILGLSFSLVLIQITQNNVGQMYYNILLLDEKDATLDEESRAKFIDLLEVYMHTIKAEQLFLISHNNMFDSYPVNVILTSEMQSFNYSQASVMRLYE